MTDADLAKVARLPHLQSINLAYTRITDQGLEHLAPLEHVKVLKLYYAESVTDEGIAHLKHWKNLEHLDLRGTKVTSTLFEHIARMTSLRFLDVGYSRVNDDSFELLENLDQLEHLAFGGNKMSGTALPSLKLLPALKELSVSGHQRTDSGLWSVAVTDFNIGHIAQLPRLEVLDLGETNVSDRGIAELARLKNLHTLDLQGDPGDQQGNCGPERPAQAAASEALEGQRHRRCGGRRLPADGKPGGPRTAGDEHHRKGAGAALGEAGPETALHRRHRHQA